MMAAEAVAAPGSEATSATESVLVAPVQGSAALRTRHGERILGAVRRALEVRGYPETVAHDLLGQAIVACQTPECVEQALDAAGAAFAIVPAIWSREARRRSSRWAWLLGSGTTPSSSIPLRLPPGRQSGPRRSPEGSPGGSSARSAAREASRQRTPEPPPSLSTQLALT